MRELDKEGGLVEMEDDFGFACYLMRERDSVTVLMLRFRDILS